MKGIDVATTRLKELFGWSDDHAEYRLTWEEAMERPLIYHVDLEQGGEIRIKINHEATDGPFDFGGWVFN